MRAETAREADGRWIAAITNMRGALGYGVSREGASANVHALGLRVVAD